MVMGYGQRQNQQQGQMSGYFGKTSGNVSAMRAGLKRKPDAADRGDNKRAVVSGPEAEKVVAELRALIEAKCIPIAQKCCDEGLTEMVRFLPADRMLAYAKNCFHAWKIHLSF
jgi:hypothetical protein